MYDLAQNKFYQDNIRERYQAEERNAEIKSNNSGKYNNKFFMSDGMIIAIKSLIHGSNTILMSFSRAWQASTNAPAAPGARPLQFPYTERGGRRRACARARVLDRSCQRSCVAHPRARPYSAWRAQRPPP